MSYHWYSENGAHLPDSWRTLASNPGDLFVQSAQFLVSARRIKALIAELAPGTKVYCNEIGVLAPDLPPDHYCYPGDTCACPTTVTLTTATRGTLVRAQPL